MRGKGREAPSCVRFLAESALSLIFAPKVPLNGALTPFLLPNISLTQKPANSLEPVSFAILFSNWLSIVT